MLCLSLGAQVFGVGWLTVRAWAYVYEHYEDLALQYGLRTPDAPTVVVSDIATSHVKVHWSQSSLGRQRTRQVR